MPAVIRTPGVRPGNKTVFKAYEKPTNKKRKHGSVILEGENQANAEIKFRGTNDTAQKYCLIAKDLKTGQLSLIDAPLFNVEAYSPALNKPELAQSIRQAGVQNWQQRNSLGEAFGTKKAKTALTDVQRNKLDADMLEGLEDAIIDNVQTRTASMPSVEERKEIIEAERPIPKYDPDTERVSEIYKLEDLVSSEELDLLDPIVEEIMASKPVVTDEALALLPFSDSDFLNARIHNVVSEDSNIKQRLQLLCYISLLIAVYNNRRVNNKKTLMEKIPNLSFKLFDGILDRFAIAKAGRFGTSKDMSFTFDPFHTNKLLSYMLVLMLHTNNYSVDLTPLSHELSISTMKLSGLCRNLGCMVRSASKEEIAARELPTDSSASYKIASLTAPLKLPNVVRGKRA